MDQGGGNQANFIDDYIFMGYVWRHTRKFTHKKQSLSESS